MQNGKSCCARCANDLGDVAGDVTEAELQAAIQQQGPTSGPQNDARARGLYSVIAQVATGQQLSDAEIETAVVGAASLVNPALGAAMAVGVTILNVIQSTMMAAITALGLDANGGPPYQPCDPPPTPGDSLYKDPVAEAAKYQALAAQNTPFGSFERFAAPLIASNMAKLGNCVTSMDPEALLAQLQATWNETHAGPIEQVPIGNGPVTPASTFGGQPQPETIGDILQRPWYLSGGVITPLGFDSSTADAYPENLRDLEINRGPILASFATQSTLVGSIATSAILGVAHAPTLIAHTAGAGTAAAAQKAATPMSTPAKVAVAGAATAGLGAVGWAAFKYGPDIVKLFRSGRSRR